MSDPNPQGLDRIEQQILARRTTALAKASATPREPSGVDALIVRTGNRLVAILLDDVIAAAALTRLTLVPFAPAEVAGVTLLDGVVAPVFHLHALLGFHAISLPEHARVVLVGDRAAPLALVVEAAESITRIELPTLLPLPESATFAARRTRGITASGTIVLDVEAMLADPALTLDVAQRRDQD